MRGPQTIPAEEQVRVRLSGPVVVGFKAFRSPRVDVVDQRLFKRGTPRDAQMAACAGDAAVVLEPTPQVEPGCRLMQVACKRRNRATHGVAPPGPFLSAVDDLGAAQAARRTFPRPLRAFRVPVGAE
jgi:hypothetical protein